MTHGRVKAAWRPPVSRIEHLRQEPGEPGEALAAPATSRRHGRADAGVRQNGLVLGLEMVVVLGVALLLCGALARRFPVAPALLLVLVGVLIGFIPTLRRSQLPPEVVLLLFLPAAVVLGEPDHVVA